MSENDVGGGWGTLARIVGKDLLEDLTLEQDLSDGKESVLPEGAGEGKGGAGRSGKGGPKAWRWE